MSSITIRVAAPSDADSIVRVFSATWPEESIKLSQVVSALKKREHMTFVAESEGSVVGFLDAFATISREGRCRWEMDLLAVHPGFRGRGLGVRLVAGGTAAGHERGVPLARALIAVDNVASQRTFARCGYQMVANEYLLYLWARGTASIAWLDDARVLPVTTLRYRGLWLEEPWTVEQFASAVNRKCEEEYDVVGAVIPETQRESVVAAEAAGFESVGHYQWWTVDLQDGMPKLGSEASNE